MHRDRLRIRLGALMAIVAIAAVVSSITSKDARRRRGVVVPGDTLHVEAAAVPAYSLLAGDIQVDTDGTIPLGLFGRLSVADSTEDEVRARMVEHLRLFLGETPPRLVVTVRRTSGAPLRRRVGRAGGFWPGRTPAQ